MTETDAWLVWNGHLRESNPRCPDCVEACPCDEFAAALAVIAAQFQDFPGVSIGVGWAFTE